MQTNFEELQMAWKALDAKWVAQKTLSEQLVLSMISERSGSTLTAMSRKNLALAALFLFYTFFFAACIAGNAFDYEQPVFYIPLFIQGITCFTFAVLLWKVYRNISNVQLSRDNLATSLRKVIHVNDQHLVMSRKVWWCYFIAGITFPFTFLPRVIEHRGLAEGLSLTVIPVVIIAALVLLAKKLQLFRDSKNDLLKKNLQELESYLVELEQ
ncbi:hypothetical protein D3H65_15390 [Paraflavitalea soli]|uniref:Uncharacterized protein n=1 Tax=Paraflavitalea soli TaxID=2315862 RepID=A0A3B7MLJ0_9BACT|nr:hypothetical protein [Paraflavitalea soli]AXY75282.1 hypothetical protein D3H65_15390 [Paraflavitalea soli]